MHETHLEMLNQFITATNTFVPCDNIELVHWLLMGGLLHLVQCTVPITTHNSLLWSLEVPTIAVLSASKNPLA